MLTWSKILCAVDFSESSRAALEGAAELAQRLGADLTLIHVRELPLPADGPLLAPELLEADARELAAKLETWRAAAERRAGRPVRAELQRGLAVPELLAAVRAGRYDLLVTGTHARRGVRRVLLGSVAETLAREAPCPVLVAREAPDRGD